MSVRLGGNHNLLRDSTVVQATKGPIDTLTSGMCRQFHSFAGDAICGEVTDEARAAHYGSSLFKRFSAESQKP
jgi:hypothetical protein